MKSSSGIVNVVTSNQLGIHKNLVDIVKKHAITGFRRPIATHTQDAFNRVQSLISKQNSPIILDSGCGTAMSTRHIAKQYPDSWVIGIDRSIVRLQKQTDDTLPNNAITVQANLVDFWRLAVQANWKLQRHFILYPNPYPKASQLKQRWHGHPVFHHLVKLGGQLEIRTNWKIYVDEFALAMQISGYGNNHQVESFVPNNYWTLFEKKYHQAGQCLYRYRSDLSH